MKKGFLLTILFAGFSFASLNCLADIHIKQTQNIAGRSLTSEVFIKGKRKRSETDQGTGKSISITQCDLKRTITLNEGTHKYLITSMDATGAAAGSNIDVSTGSEPSRKGGTVTYTTTITDTGERKQMFGFTARHVKSSMTSDPSPDACNTEKMRFETDGWYIDFDYDISCDTDSAVQMMANRPRGGCHDQVKSKQLGAGKLGYPVQTTTRILDADGNETFSITSEVVDLQQGALDAALFDLPAGYTEARSSTELYAAAPETGGNSSAAANAMNGMPGMGSTTGNPAAAAAAAPGGKPAGIIRIGVVNINNRTSESVNSETLRQKLITALTKGNHDAVAIYAQSPSDVAAEAKLKGCDFVLYTDVTNVKQSNKVGGILGRAAGVPGMGKSSYESQIEFRLLPAGADSPVLQSKASGKQDGDATASVGSAVTREADMVISAAKK